MNISNKVLHRQHQFAQNRFDSQHTMARYVLIQRQTRSSACYRPTFAPVPLCRKRVFCHTQVALYGRTTGRPPHHVDHAGMIWLHNATHSKTKCHCILCEHDNICVSYPLTTLASVGETVFRGRLPIRVFPHQHAILNSLVDAHEPCELMISDNIFLFS